MVTDQRNHLEKIGCCSEWKVLLKKESAAQKDDEVLLTSPPEKRLG